MGRRTGPVNLRVMCSNRPVGVRGVRRIAVRLTRLLPGHFRYASA